MRDYLFFYPVLAPIGGAEATAAWMLQVLLERGTVTIVTLEDPDFAALDALYGTSLNAAPPQVVKAEWQLCRWLDRLGLTNPLLRFRYLLRVARQLRREHHFCVSSFHDLDLGEPPAFQYLHVGVYNHSSLLSYRSLMGTVTPLKKMLAVLYLKLCDLVAPWGDRRAGQNFTAANSRWCAAEFSKHYGRDPEAVLFPPAIGAFHVIPKSVNSFVSLARAHPDKGCQDVIDIVAALRARGHQVGLTMFVIPSQPGYAEALKLQAEQHSGWLRVVVNGTRAEIDATLATHAYGLHASHHEGFGMAIAEMLLAGCLTSARNQGGQSEIVSEPELLFTDNREAIEKWDCLLASLEERKRLLASQQARRQRYTLAGFLDGFHSCLDRFEESAKDHERAFTHTE